MKSLDKRLNKLEEVKRKQRPVPVAFVDLDGSITLSSAGRKRTLDSEQELQDFIDKNDLDRPDEIGIFVVRVEDEHNYSDSTI